MFAFAPPMKRGPSASFHREETSPKVEFRVLEACNQTKIS